MDVICCYEAPIWLGKIKSKRFNEYASRATFTGKRMLGSGSNRADLKILIHGAAKRTDAGIYGPLLGISYVLDSAADRWFALFDVHANRARFEGS